MPRCPEAQMPRCPKSQMPRSPDAQTYNPGPPCSEFLCCQLGMPMIDCTIQITKIYRNLNEQAFKRTRSGNDFFFILIRTSRTGTFLHVIFFGVIYFDDIWSFFFYFFHEFISSSKKSISNQSVLFSQHVSKCLIYMKKND